MVCHHGIESVSKREQVYKVRWVTICSKLQSHFISTAVQAENNNVIGQYNVTAQTLQQ